MRQDRSPTRGGRGFVVHRQEGCQEDELLLDGELEDLGEAAGLLEEESDDPDFCDEESDDPEPDPSPVLAAAGLLPDSLPSLLSLPLDSLPDPEPPSVRLSVR